MNGPKGAFSFEGRLDRLARPTNTAFVGKHRQHDRFRIGLRLPGPNKIATGRVQWQKKTGRQPGLKKPT